MHAIDRPNLAIEFNTKLQLSLIVEIPFLTGDAVVRWDSYDTVADSCSEHHDVSSAATLSEFPSLDQH